MCAPDVKKRRQQSILCYCRRVSDFEKSPFYPYLGDTYSQNGEDGVLAELFNRIKDHSSISESPLCVEFGAWDGMYLSNTFNFVATKGWNAIYIEGDPKKFSKLLNTVSEYPTIKPILKIVSPSGNSENSIDAILTAAGCPRTFELLAIDIDSYDLDVWDSMNLFSAAIVVIEINSGIPPGVVTRHSKRFPGSSFSATLNIAKKKGYTLVCHTGNLIFVKNELCSRCRIPQRFIDFPELLFRTDLLLLPSNRGSICLRFGQKIRRFLYRFSVK